jgi:hypothetical protein
VRLNKTNQEVYDKTLFEKIILQKMNSERFSVAIMRARNALGSDVTPKQIFEKAIEILFEDLITEFSPAVQKVLVEKWQTMDWIIFSERNDQSINSRPVGEARVYSIDHFQLVLDKKLESLSGWQKLLKMLALTHIIGPQIQILQTEGMAFYQQTYYSSETLTMSSAFWTMAEIFGFVQFQKIFLTEVKSSGLILTEIRDLLEILQDQFKNDSFFLLNKYIVNHHPISLAHPGIKKYLNEWFKSSLRESPYPLKNAERSEVKTDFNQKKAEIISLQTRRQNHNYLKCREFLID